MTHIEPPELSLSLEQDDVPSGGSMLVFIRVQAGAMQPIERVVVTAGSQTLGTQGFARTRSEAPRP
jgi:hypothetical protein